MSESRLGLSELITVRRPADGAAVATYRPVDERGVREAVAVAAEAAPAWAALHPRARGELMTELARLMERDAPVLARLDSEDGGKPITDCITGDVPGAIESIRWFAEAADKVSGSVAPTDDSALGITTRHPMGAVAALVPWNYPLAMAAWKIGPALASGNCLLLKPAEATPRSVQHLAALAAEAGLPTGVLTVLPGHGAVTGRALAEDPLVRAISFTGAQATGRQILAGAGASNFKRVSLEMGGKSPQILMRDALSFGEELFEEMAVAAFLNSGQNCTAGSRIYVDASIFDEVVGRLVAVAEKLVLGDPAEARTQMGPLINHAALERAESAVSDAVTQGAELLTGGSAVQVLPGGHYLPATVVSNVPRDCALSREETFAPVVTVSPFRDEDEAIALANDTEYGLAASVWSRDIDSALRVARRVEAGVVSINCYGEGDITTPFGGWKQSGFGGAEKSLAGFDQWTLPKVTWLRTRSGGV
ncbi:aldehyde dehydrogenase family protein [Nocardioides immobilis]|uniref:aldehyde dehydrogenase family protein n=1 Tax=Nocardioides immobilis TaxID=2049295 RepID=UPI001C70EFD9|nr:aldehyde dehydrogenase family protein [Nocardioides immobilis]